MAPHDEFGITRRGFIQGVIGTAAAARGLGVADAARIDIVTVKV